MTIQRLNNRDHATLRVRQDLSEYEKSIYSPVVLPEFRKLQTCYPLVFIKPADGSAYQPVALLGLQAEENLFVDEGEWKSPHIPLLIERGPFLIGTSGSSKNEDSGENFVAINSEHKAVSITEGERLFNEDGSNTEYLDHLSDILKLIHSGVQTTTEFVNAVTTHDLITPLTLRVPLSRGNAAEVTGLFAIDEERVQLASERVLMHLHNNNWLMPIYMMIASLAQVTLLADRKNQRIHRKT
jgi:hypothetical protein